MDHAFYSVYILRVPATNTSSACKN